MEQIVSAVMDAVHRAGLVEVEVSARHVHLSQADVEVLFGSGAVVDLGQLWARRQAGAQAAALSAGPVPV